MASKTTAETAPYPHREDEPQASSQGTGRSAGGPQGFQKSGMPARSNVSSQGTSRTVGGGRSVASWGQSGSPQTARSTSQALVHGEVAGPRGRAQQASEPGWVPSGHTVGMEGRTGSSGGRAAGQRERETPGWWQGEGSGIRGVQVGNSYQVGGTYSFAKSGDTQAPSPEKVVPANKNIRVGFDKNVSTPVTGS